MKVVCDAVGAIYDIGGELKVDLEGVDLEELGNELERTYIPEEVFKGFSTEFMVDYLERYRGVECKDT